MALYSSQHFGSYPQFYGKHLDLCLVLDMNVVMLLNNSSINGSSVINIVYHCYSKTLALATVASSKTLTALIKAPGTIGIKGVLLFS